ncbi:MAG: glycoside hydrolase family 127 protein [Planctomycetes bacterium]|nr:glycoside hydrolase family 127 protein [Planctomycetota bacterium]
MTFRSILALLLLAAGQEPESRARFERIPGTEFDLRGPFRDTVDALTRQWLLRMPEANPAVLEMFADRDKKPPRSLLPWSGEFAGKYLTGAVQILRLTGDRELKESLARFVARLIKLQDTDGYLGPFPRDSRLTGKAPNAGGDTWDAWGHYHVMLGLLLWHEETQDAKALDCAVKIGDLLCRKFLKSGKKMVSMGSAEMNHAPLHSLVLLHRRTKVPKYLELARQIVEEFQDKAAGDYVRVALAGKEFFQGPKPRWESLHPVMGLAELYLATGDDAARKAFEQIWWSICKFDRHNTGGFSSGEQAKGNPYDKGAVETCCTIAWVALGVEMLRLTGDSIVADELELSTLNAVAGCQSRTGTWCTYNTPMDGRRVKSTDDIAFQKRPGSEEVNCCSANAPRGFGMVGDWAVMRVGKGIALNWYGPSTISVPVAGTKVTLKQETEYPREGTVVIEVAPEKPVEFTLRLRIPHWSARTTLKVNGAAVEAKPGLYAAVERTWTAGDRIEIAFDFSFHFWVGERELGGRTSIYRGPILLVHESKGAALPQFSKGWQKEENLWSAGAAGASFEVAFEGAAIVWRGRRFDDGGMARISIDGKEIDRVDQFSPQKGVIFVWELAGLEDKPHKMKVQILEERNPGSLGRRVTVGSLSSPKDDPPAIDASSLKAKRVKVEGASAPLVLLELEGAEPPLRLRDFATAGEAGREYASWLSVEKIKPAPFSPENPLRSARPER